MATIRVKTKKGFLRQRVTLTEWIDKDGRQFTTAERDGKTYVVIGHDELGAIWGRGAGT